MDFCFMVPLFCTELSDTRDFRVLAQEATTECTDMERTSCP